MSQIKPNKEGFTNDIPGGKVTYLPSYILGT